MSGMTVPPYRRSNPRRADSGEFSRQLLGRKSTSDGDLNQLMLSIWEFRTSLTFTMTGLLGIAAVLREMPISGGVIGSLAESLPKLGGVIDRPFAERPRRCSDNLPDCGCDKCRLADCGCPRVQQHAYGWQRHHSQQLTL